MTVSPEVKSAIRRVVRAIGQQEKIKGTVTVVWAGNETVRRLNKKFRKIDRTTDVLSFPTTPRQKRRRGTGRAGDGKAGRQGRVEAATPSLQLIRAAERVPVGRQIGDIIIAVPQAIRQAPRFHNAPPQELLRLAVHGVYHLLGYDHHRPAEAADMKKREAWALRQ